MAFEGFAIAGAAGLVLLVAVELNVLVLPEVVAVVDLLGGDAEDAGLCPGLRPINLENILN